MSCSDCPYPVQCTFGCKYPAPVYGSPCTTGLPPEWVEREAARIKLAKQRAALLGDEALHAILQDLAARQEPLGAEFEAAIGANRDGLYEE